MNIKIWNSKKKPSKFFKEYEFKIMYMVSLNFFNIH